MTPADEAASQLMFAKAKYRAQPEEQIDTRAMRLPKLHPDRNPKYRAWLHRQPCAIKGLTDNRTGQPHICWSPSLDAFGRPLSDPCHTGKAYSGRLKRNDSGCFALCRHGHRDHESQMDAFDAAYGIDRFAIAAELFAKFSNEK